MEEPRNDKSKTEVEVSYYSVLVKVVPKSTDASDPFQNLDQVQVLIFVEIELINFIYLSTC